MLLTTSKWKSGDEEQVASDSAEKGRRYEEKKGPTTLGDESREWETEKWKNE